MNNDTNNTNVNGNIDPFNNQLTGGPVNTDSNEISPFPEINANPNVEQNLEKTTEIDLPILSNTTATSMPSNNANEENKVTQNDANLNIFDSNESASTSNTVLENSVANNNVTPQEINPFESANVQTNNIDSTTNQENVASNIFDSENLQMIENSDANNSNSVNFFGEVSEVNSQTETAEPLTSPFPQDNNIIEDATNSDNQLKEEKVTQENVSNLDATTPEVQSEKVEEPTKNIEENPAKLNNPFPSVTANEIENFPNSESNLIENNNEPTSIVENQQENLNNVTHASISQEQSPINANENPAPINNISVENLPTPEITNKEIQPTKENNLSNEEYIQLYVGKNYNKISTRLFNIAAFFGSYMYLFYRGMYLFGLIAFIATITINLTLNNIYISLIINLLCGFGANKLYMSRAKKRVEKILSIGRENASNELKVLCQNAGGTSGFGVVIAVLLNSVYVITSLIIIISTILSQFIQSSEFEKIIQDIQNNLNIPVENYNGTANTDELNGEGSANGWILYDGSIDPNNVMTISVPDKFQKVEDSQMEYSFGETFSKCSIKINALSENIDAQTFINNMHIYHNSEFPVENKTFNNIAWYSVKIDDVFGNTTYYATDINSKVYLIEYENENEEETSCSSYENTILNSIDLVKNTL